MAALAVTMLVLTGADPGKKIKFLSALDDAPLDLKLRPKDKLTGGLKIFYATGRNPYKGDAKAVARGKALYTEFCQPCHMADAAGRFGPSLVDDVHINPRAGSDVGKFEVVMGGAFGAMRSFYDRMSQDEMLKTLAYIDKLGKAKGK